MRAILTEPDWHTNMTTQPSKTLETFPNPSPQRDYHIHMEIPEFTCLCPKTGQPDFATLVLDYIADQNCVELKSLKLYIWSFRNEGHFHEDVTNRILDDLVAALPRRHLPQRGRRTPQARLAACAARRTVPLRHAIEHPWLTAPRCRPHDVSGPGLRDFRRPRLRHDR